MSNSLIFYCGADVKVCKKISKGKDTAYACGAVGEDAKDECKDLSVGTVCTCTKDLCLNSAVAVHGWGSAAALFATLAAFQTIFNY